MKQLNLEIERLRAVAVLLVLVQHWGNFFAVRRPWAGVLEQLGFWVGVDIFFVISGFVITSSLIEGFAGGNRTQVLKSFFIKRCLRLWPLAWVWVFIIAGAAFTLQRPDLFGDSQASLAAMLGIFLHVANLLAYCFHADLGCFNAAPADSFGIYWSLSLEEQFYFFYALLFFMARGSPKVCIGVFVLLFAIQLPWVRPFPTFGWFVRLDALACGCMLYYYRRLLIAKLAVCPAWVGRMLALLAVVLAVRYAPMLSKQVGGVSLLALLCSVPVLLAMPARGLSLSYGGLANRLLEYLGSRSYSIYLAHMPTMRLVQAVWSPSAPGWGIDLLYVLLILSMILLLSELGYRLIETPLRRKGRILAKRSASNALQTSTGLRPVPQDIR